MGTRTPVPLGAPQRLRGGHALQENDLALEDDTAELKFQPQVSPAM